MTRMHLSVLVCIVALVSLASARDILQVTTDTTGELVLQNAAVTAFEQPSALAEPSDVAATSTLIVPGTATVPVNGEICVNIPANCYSGECVEMSGGNTYKIYSKIEPHVKQFCVARGATTPSPQVPDPSSIPNTCGPTPGSWALLAALPTSWCTWPGVGCRTPYTARSAGTTTPISNHPCASGLYIYSVHQQTPLTTDPSYYRQGFYASGFTDSYADTACPAACPACPTDTGYCVKCNPTVCGAPTISATPGTPYTITIPGRAVCKLGRDSQKKDELRCY